MLSHLCLRSSILAPLVLIAGCASWHTYDSAGMLQPGQSLPHQMRATRADSSRIDLTAPFVRSDSLYGLVSGDTLGLALADIMRLERSRFSVSRTGAVLVGGPLIGLGLLYVVQCGIRDCRPVYGLE